MSRYIVPERKTQAGFSLIEVICALAISAIALVALYRGLGNAQFVTNAMESHVAARIIAQSILDDEYHATNTAAGTRQGDSGIYQWQLTIEPARLPATDKLPNAFRLYRLTVEVSWPPRGRFQLDTLKLGR